MLVKKFYEKTVACLASFITNSYFSPSSEIKVTDKLISQLWIRFIDFCSSPPSLLFDVLFECPFAVLSDKLNISINLVAFLLCL